MVYSLTARDEAQKDRILSGGKKAQLFLKNFCKEQFRVGDKLIISYPIDQPIGAYEVTESRECSLIEVGVEGARDAGYPMWPSMVEDLRGAYPHVQPDTMVIFIRWRSIDVPPPRVNSRLFLFYNQIIAYEKEQQN